jgi:hypothetical protein
MGEILGVGVTHYPRLAGPDATMAGTLKMLLRHKGFPAHLRDPSDWPAEMREEWADDEGAAAAARHRKTLVEHLRRVRVAIDTFAPDIVVLWGDDQYENFREDLIPAFSILAYERASTPWSMVKYGPNVWGQPDDADIVVHGHRAAAKALASGLLEEGFDVAYAYEPLHQPGLSHAFLNTVLYLDYDRRGFDYPVVPFAVNCYGRRVVTQRGFLPDPRLEAAPELLDPPSPSPARCFDLGRATARVLAASPYRAVLCASASWSHGFLTAKHNYLYPDTSADRRLHEALQARDYDAWRRVTLAEVEDSGQQEMLNWFCLIGAMAELGHVPAWSEMVETHLFNSNKCFAIFRPDGPR